MDELYNQLRKLPKEVLELYILELMREEKISFSDLAATHTQYLEMLRKGQTEELMKLRGRIVSIWCDTKRNIGHNLTALMQEAKDNGWANITQEKIDNSKWNK